LLMDRLFSDDDVKITFVLLKLQCGRTIWRPELRRFLLDLLFFFLLDCFGRI